MKELRFIQLNNVKQVTRGSREHMKVYLVQFSEMIPQRIDLLKTALQEQDRKRIRQIIHKMGPQVQFFGIPGAVPMIRKVETEYEQLSFLQLEQLCEQLLAKLFGAKTEIEELIAEL